MATAANPLSIINKIKSFVAKTSRSILWRGKPKENDISEKIAQRIQKNSYDLSLRRFKDAFTPPYLKLAEQLQVDDNQILRAAVYNLANIAVVRTKYAEDILRLLEKYRDDDTKPQELREYAGRKINFIRTYSGSKKTPKSAA